MTEDGHPVAHDSSVVKMHTRCHLIDQPLIFEPVSKFLCRICETSPVAAIIGFHARVAKLADALDLGSCTLIGVGVRLPPLAFFL